ncbi:hypothetical protein CDAR_97091 [Caerostris darwini]|uniref:Uncharacterized protein n=1 Tax=Caerostris darwini TaxID=1538125 RepID=A0AAV4QQX6_9ARAC|nr:hypothetical protein CDAR_97091 [Caerostris darwini]
MAATRSTRYFYSETNIESLLKYYKDGYQDGKKMAATRSTRYFYSEPNVESLLKYNKDGYQDDEKMAVTRSTRYFYSEANIESLLKYYKDGKFMIIKRKYENSFRWPRKCLGSFQGSLQLVLASTNQLHVGGPVEDIKPFSSIVLKLSFHYWLLKIVPRDCDDTGVGGVTSHRIHGTLR